MKRKFLFNFSNNKSSKKLRIGIGKYQFFMALYKKPTIQTIGITNETEDLCYVPFIDYDNINLNKVISEAKKLILSYSFCGLALICSSQKKADDGMLYGNYHLIGLDKMSFSEHQDMLDITCCDQNFRRVPEYFRFKHWVLRIYPKCDEKTWEVLKEKPIFLYWINGRNRLFECSKAHYDFLRKYYDIPNLKLNLDNSKKVNIIDYRTTHG